MKKILFVICFTFCFSILNNAKAQIVGFGGTFPFSSNTGAGIDAGTNIYGYDSYPSGPGGYRSIVRINNYWYMMYTGIGLAESSRNYYGYRTTTTHATINPPACAEWQTYNYSSFVQGREWVGYPTSIPTNPDGIVSTVILTGSTLDITPTTSSAILPNYIDLANRSPSDILSYSNQAGRILFNNCNEAIQFNNGSSWKSVWPNNGNYDLTMGQSLNIGSPNNKITSRYTNGAQMVFKTNNIERLIIESDNISNSFASGANFNIKTSIGTPVKVISTDYTILIDDHIIIHPGSTPHILTIPSAFTSGGRQLIITNLSTAALSTGGTSIIGFTGTSIAAGQNITIVSSGGSWYKIN